jgi:hypothetical protein
MPEELMQATLRLLVDLGIVPPGQRLSVCKIKFLVITG